MSLEDVPRCQHLKVNGTQCGSPALRYRRFCFFHDRFRREQARIAASASAAVRPFQLPLLEDANAVQLALMKVIQLLGSGQMDHKTAGLMLYALQTASVNLRQVDFEPDDVSDIVIDRDTTHLTCINGPQWYEEDFDEQEDDEDEEEGNDDEEEDDEDESASMKEKENSAQKTSTKPHPGQSPSTQVSPPRSQPSTSPIPKRPPASAALPSQSGKVEPEKKSPA